MPKIDTETPKSLKPYLFHGMDLTWGNGTEASADCPFCGKESKFSVNVSNGLWRCFNCESSSENGAGNVTKFLCRLWEESFERTTYYDELSKNRNVSTTTLAAWGVCLSVITDEWLVPGYSISKSLNQLYRYVNGRPLATSTMPLKMYGLNLFDKSKSIVCICEGPWDAMALWERLSTLKEGTDGKLSPTSNASKSLAADINVVAVPGCNTFQESWTELFEGKAVYILFDNDYPTENPKTGKRITPPGYSGAKRLTGILSGSTYKPESIGWLSWGGDQDHDPELPKGYDVRDFLSDHEDPRDLLGMLGPVPEEWIDESGSSSSTNKQIELMSCEDYRTLIMSWRKAMKWTDGLDHALTVMLASVTSTMSIGDQLWIKVIGPASCGKSTLCEAISTSRKYVLAKSTIRGFHSGFKSDKDGEEDNSLIAQIGGKTLVTKDGDTLLQSPNLGQILSEARDVYDCTSRTHYRNKMSKEYSGIRMTWLLCGTSSLRSIDSSELGERFLDCVIMDGIDDELEDEILMRVVNKADRNMALEADGTPESQQEPSMTEAMQLTGGYITYLRENAIDLLSTVVASSEAKIMCARIGKFVAYMRARPSKVQEEEAEREFAARLVSQHLRLAKCLAVVLGKTRLDAEVMRRTVRVGLDTSRGQTLDITRILYEAHPEGLELRTISSYTNRGDDKTRPILRFLRQIGVIDTYRPNKKGIKGKMRYRLTDRLEKLYGTVVIGER